MHDSTRWEGFRFRPDDVVIATPPKAGTTWMQMIVRLLIFQDPDTHRSLAEISPWLDMQNRDVREIFARLEAQTHRRFIKSHTPLDGLPWDDRVTYILVGRDPRDTAVSIDHHRANFEIVRFLERRGETTGNDDLASLLDRDPISTADTLEGRFWDWVDSPAPAEHTTTNLANTLRHYAEALAARDRDNVVVVHYGDLKADLEGEMRRIAGRLGIEVAEARWPALVKAATFDEMRKRADELVPNSDDGFFTKHERFFHSGTGGHWRSFFDDAAQRRYDARVAELTTPEVAAWAHGGAKTLARRR